MANSAPKPTDRCSKLLRGIVRGAVPRNVIVAELHRHNLAVTAKDLLTLTSPDGWVNDEVVNFYMALLGDAASPANTALRVFALGSFFFTKLVNAGYEGVRRWSNDIDLPSLDLLLFPIHKHGDHWMLLSVNFQARVLEIFDSLPSPVHDEDFLSRLFHSVTAYLDNEMSAAHAATTWKSADMKVVTNGVPKQTDGSSCGVFMLMFASFLRRGERPPFTMPSTKMMHLREGLSLSILRGRCL